MGTVPVCYALSMEKFPSSAPKSIESRPEKILTGAEVLEAISAYAEGYTLGRELSDEKGVYLREVEVKGEKEGEVTEYRYIRKGEYANNNASTETVIERVTYEDGVPTGGERVAVFNDETGEWKKL
jgi:hypothetical protein